MGLRTSQLDPNRKYGLLITDLSEADLKDDGLRRELKSLWIEHGLMLFKGAAGVSFQLALSRVFGQLEPHRVKEMWVEGNSDLINLSYGSDDTGEIWEVDGEPRGAYQPWHSDQVYSEAINHGGILRAINLPSSGGETGFIDQIEAYEMLPADLRHRIEDLRIVYKLDNDYSKYYGWPKVSRLLRGSSRYEAIQARQYMDFPPVVHPVVYRQPETGRAVLNVSPACALYIEGMQTAEGNELLRELIDRVTDRRLVYYQKWTLDMMLLWDNWRMLHMATGVPAGEARSMQRTTIAGDYELGRKLPWPTAEAELAVKTAWA